MQLSSAEEIKNAYEKIKTTLIKTINEIHPKYDEVENALRTVAIFFLEKFKYVFTLNYDLLLYWAISIANRDSYQNSNRDLKIVSM